MRRLLRCPQGPESPSNPGERVHNRYWAVVDQDACTGCGTSSDRCQMNAIGIDDAARVDTPRCMGCGLLRHHLSRGGDPVERKAQSAPGAAPGQWTGTHVHHCPETGNLSDSPQDATIKQSFAAAPGSRSIRSDGRFDNLFPGRHGGFPALLRATAGQAVSPEGTPSRVLSDPHLNPLVQSGF